MRLEWKGDQVKSLQIPSPFAEIVTGEGIFEGNLARFGHGLQRSYLFALLHVLSNCEDSGSPTLILGCEEPELFQHPPQLRHLASVFRQLSAQNSQIILCTHSPYFVSGENFDQVRFVRKELPSCESKVSHTTIDQITQAFTAAYAPDKPVLPSGMLLKIHHSLQPEINEMFFTQTIILVEGGEDSAYITTYFHLLNKWEEFRRLGCHIVPVQGKSSLVKPIAVAKVLKIPVFVVFDADDHVPVARQDKRTQHAKDNIALQRLLGVQTPVDFPSDDVWADDFVMWKTEIGKVVNAELVSINYESILDSIRTRYGDPGHIDKNSLFIADALSEAWSKQGKSPSLEKLCVSIINFARKQQEPQR